MKDHLLISGALITMGSLAGLFVHMLGLSSVALLITFLVGISLVAVGQINSSNNAS